MNKIFTFIFIVIAFTTLSSNSIAQEEIPEKYRVHLDFSKVVNTLISDTPLTLSQPQSKKKKRKFTRSLKVRASAYNSLRDQTDNTPNIAAWGDRLKPGMKVIAVSRDLLTKYGLKRNTIVKIKGLPGTYRVADKMNKRFRKKIDIYMGNNRRKALKWGNRRVTIMW